MTRPPASPPQLLVTGSSLLVTPLGCGPLGLRDVRIERRPRGAVAAWDGRVGWIGDEADVPRAWREGAAVRLDAGGGTIVPGFVDAHTHAVFAGWREDEFCRRLAGATYAEIAAAGGGIVRTMAATRAASEGELASLLAGRLGRMLLLGVTTVEVKSGYGLDPESELRQLRAVRTAAAAHPGRVVPTFMGAHAVPPEWRERRAEYVRRVAGEMLPRVAGEGLATACDVFCDRGAFSVDEARVVLRAAAARGLLLKVHADELSSSGGAELAAELGAVSAEHLLHASDAGLAAMAASGTVAVLLPATAYLLRETPVAAARLRAANVAVAAATDFNPGSSPCESLPLAASMACVGNGLSADEALAAITLNGAAACGLAADTGTLEPGKRADLAVLDAPSHEHLPYRFGANLVRHVVAGGRLVVEDGRPA